MKNILVVVDMQNDFVDGVLGTNEAVQILPAVAAKIKEFEGDIYVTLDTHFENYLDTAEGKKLPVPHCVKGTDGWNINREVKTALDEKKYEIIEKTTFGSVDLPEKIKNTVDGEKFTIELIGLCTDICVVSNALILKANFPEIAITVNAACCAGVTPEKHLAALETMRSCQVNIK